MKTRKALHEAAVLDLGLIFERGTDAQFFLAAALLSELAPTEAAPIRGTIDCLENCGPECIHVMQVREKAPGRP